ncbi:MAG TPA: DUF5939 domain-containing protein, partial [Gemmatimonadota bacterium]|nr:DUF5939 domain-containing protein [Gemmatimonadota bacterium]
MTIPPNQELLDEKLEGLTAAIPDQGKLIRAIGDFIRTAPDDELVRINPIRFGQQRGFPPDAVVGAFLHARRLGLLTMEWQYVCPGCGEIVERLSSLAFATA